MNEPTVKITADRTQRIFIPQGESLIVTPERAQALAGFCSVADVWPKEDAPEPDDRMVRGKKSK